MKQVFDSTVRYVWNAGMSQIYQTLRTLYQADLVSVEERLSENGMNQKIYSLTEAGHQELHRWLNERVAERYSKNEFLAKLFFCGFTDDTVAKTHVQQYLQELEQEMTFLEESRSRYSEPSLVHRPHLLEYQLLTLEWLTALTQTNIEMARKTLSLMEGKMAKPSDSNRKG